MFTTFGITIMDASLPDNGSNSQVQTPKLATDNTDAVDDLFKQIAEDDGNSLHRKQNEKSGSKLENYYSFYIPKRYIVTFLTALGMLLVYAMRTNVGVTVVMILDDMAHEKVSSAKDIHDLHIPRLHWDTRMIGFLHSIFYIGYFVTQIPGAYITTIWPNHKIYGVCILLSSVLNLLLPISIQSAGFSSTCVVRCLQGMAEGLVYPGCYGVLRHWSTPANRNKQVSAVLTCAYAGAILGFPAAGLTTHYFGWKYIYYISGGACIVWYLVWLCCAYEKPSHHTSISDEEFDFLEKEQGEAVIDYENTETPWLAILTSLPVLAICFCHFAWHWVFILMLTNEPLYLNLFDFNLAETGFYASIPHIAKVVLSCASGILADVLVNFTALSVTCIRKLLTGIGLSILSLGFMVLTQLYNRTAVITVLTCALGGFGLSTSGWQVNHYDLSTRHAGVLVAITSTVGSIGAVLVPMVAGELTVGQEFQGWRNLFYVTASVVALALIVFLIFGSGEQQSWAVPPPHILLVQKTDPLVKKPYRLYKLQQGLRTNKSDDKSTSSDGSRLEDVGERNNGTII